ncbi:MAG TPA: helix-turn-helix transcriptional regulator [Gammaproteobacteria bacterium]
MPPKMSKKKKTTTTIGQRVKILREEAGYTRDEFCELTGINKRTLVGIEIEGRDPQGSTLEKVAKQFPLQAEYLLIGK